MFELLTLLLVPVIEFNLGKYCVEDLIKQSVKQYVEKQRTH